MFKLRAGDRTRDFGITSANAKGVRSKGSSYQTPWAPASQHGTGLMLLPENRSPSGLHAVHRT
eukprot:6200274-Prymnesium_polylepis.1